jgi:hypothetical protein
MSSNMKKEERSLRGKFVEMKFAGLFGHIDK